MQNLLEELKKLLEKDERLVVDGKLLKNKIIELSLKLDPDLIKLLLKNESIKTHFFQEVDGGVLVFDKIKFQKFVSNKAFLPDSYTSFKNKIGLVTENEEYLSESKEVVLVWPYKDCMLEGGMEKEDEKRDEIFYNEILAPDEIDRLLEPKVLTNFKKIDKKGEHKVKEIKGNDNLIIRGNNLLALHSLKKRFAGKIKLIYIDPPYNTGNDSFTYNNSFNHSSWLSFMKNRLEIAKQLLRDDGAIFISIDENEHAYLRILCDEVFGRDNFITSLVWHSKYTTSNDAKYVSTQHENIIFFAKNKNNFNIGLLDRTDKMNNAYKNLDNDPRGPWKATPLHAKSGTEKGKYQFLFKNGVKWIAPQGRYPRFSQETLRKMDEENRIYFGKDEKATPNAKTFLSEVKQGKVVGSVWSFDEVGSTHKANEELAELFGKGVFDNPKVIGLIKQVLKVGNTKDAIILDFFAGSGTTAHAVLELNKEDGGNRQFILCEQMHYVDTVTKERVKKVIEKLGGGSFIYLELMKLNEKYIDEIKKAKTAKELLNLWEIMKEKAFLSYKVDVKQFDENVNKFEELSLENQKNFLIECLDKNHLYVNYSEIDDEDYGVREEDKKLNSEFYNR
ncbi:hypothetical protein HY02_10055 [Peptococcaceae bacterium SCADC1_2_3]|nr:hypothetical protein DK28_0202875 [Peptococcaceae bacterium SCADC1_2_3]KFI37983.1 hypothetical protein HY02_10055 [Peptococcaceae bacterium SCADC1_2_3]